MTLQGKGFFIWQVPNCEGGDANAIASLAASANLTHVLVKIANGILPYNVDKKSGTDWAVQLAQALRLQNIKVLGWHYVYGNNPVAEANIAIQRIHDINADGYVIDAEAEYKQPGKAAAANQFMTQLRAALPTLPFALSSYRFPSYHPQLPWREFLSRCDFNMPQVYWEKAHNAGDQLTRSVQEFQAMTPFRPIIPTGAAYQEHGWQPNVSEVLEFLNTSQTLNLSAANFWEWSDARSGIMPGVWEAIRDYQWGAPLPPKDICQRYIIALNSHNPNQVVDLYTPNSVHVTATQTVQGIDAIRAWYTSFFTQLLPNASFSLTSFNGTDSNRHFTWTATSSKASVQNGNDTLGLSNDKIVYHYSFFTATTLSAIR